MISEALLCWMLAQLSMHTEMVYSLAATLSNVNQNIFYQQCLRCWTALCLQPASQGNRYRHEQSSHPRFIHILKKVLASQGRNRQFLSICKANQEVHVTLVQAQCFFSNLWKVEGASGCFGKWSSDLNVRNKK